MSEPSRDDVEALIARLRGSSRAYWEAHHHDAATRMNEAADALTALLALACDKDTGEKYIERAAISEELRREALGRLAEVERALGEAADVLRALYDRLAAKNSRIEGLKEAALMIETESGENLLRAEAAESRIAVLERAAGASSTTLRRD